MGRLLLADPHLPNKLAANRADDARPCINCYTCVSCIYVGVPTRCAVNPETGLEYLRIEKRPVLKRRFVVVGGGPAGMEAALRLDALGQAVILIEKGDRLGGALRFAALGYEPNEKLLDWLRDRIARSGVEVRLKTEADPALLADLEPDEVFVATGAVRETPPIPGGDLPHVFSGDDMRNMMLGESSEALQRKTGLGARIATKVGAVSGLTANLDFVRKATRRWMPLGERIVIIGGELVGLELAEFLIERGRRVTVIEESANFGRGLTVVRRARLIPELVEHGAVLQGGASDVRILPAGVAFLDRNGQAQTVAADHVIVAKGARGDSQLADRLREAGYSVREFGDGAGVGYIEGAIRGAAEAVSASLAAEA
jgi:NADPH-dependent 2,4-dienoyl-CoA reductase/sulfur reductase-like enzyme